MVYAGHRLDSEAFGHLALCLAVAVVVVVSVRSLTGEVKLLNREPPLQDRGSAAQRDLVGATNALFLSVFFGMLIAGASLVVGDALGRSLLALALICPAVSLQECVRYLAFADRQPQRAALYDLIWLISLFALLPAAAAVSEGVPGMLIAWGAGALLSCAPFVLAHRANIRESTSVPVSAPHVRAGAPMLVEFWLASGVSQLAFILLVFWMSASEIGGIKAVLAVYGPLNILYAAAYASALPEGQVIVHDQRRFKRLFLLVSGGLAAATLLLAAGLVAVPGIGKTLFADAWVQGRHLVVVAGLAQVAASLGAGGIVGLRAAGQVRSSVKIRAVLAPVVLVTPLVGAWLAGGRGYLIGSGVAAGISAVVWWRAMLHAVGPSRPVERMAATRPLSVPE